MSIPAPSFEPGLDQLQAELPQLYYAREDPASELGVLLGALGGMIDELAAAADVVAGDQAICTASAEALLDEWAYIYGATAERLPSDPAVLRAYLTARAQEDGTFLSLIATLTTLLYTPANLVGTQLVFPIGGGGLTFPADGSGLLMFEQPPAHVFDDLVFPADGSGLVFPANGAGLLFPDSRWIEVVDDAADSSLQVSVLSYLSFDRAAFARAVERFRPAHYLPPTITESKVV